MLYATEGIESDEDLKRAMVGVASVWYEGNPCNAHLLGVGPVSYTHLTLPTTPYA